MRVLVLHNAIGAESAVDEKDVLTQRDAVTAALSRLGVRPATLGCSLNLDAVQQSILDFQPGVVFNLVESLGGTDRLMPLVPLLLESMQIPFTGASSRAILATSSKIVAKERLRALGLPTPEWISLDGSSIGSLAPASRMIIKPIWEHASVGMDDEAVGAFDSPADVTREIRARVIRYGRPLFAEQYVEGREFNLSLLAGEVLPPAEIEFVDFPEHKPRIVGHRAKWKADSFEYQQTPRRFDFPASDKRLLRTLSDLARHCWNGFGLSGFARVDFRVDQEGRPWILEVNCNPCLSPDAGFVAALQHSGLTFTTAIERILDQVWSSRKPSEVGTLT